MRKFKLVTFVAILALTLSNLSIGIKINQTTNYLANGDFEDWSAGLPDFWVNSTNDMFLQETNTVNTGVSSIALTGGLNSLLSQIGGLAISGNWQFNFSCLVYNNNNNGGITLHLSLNETGTSGTTVSSTQSVKQASWQLLSAVVTPNFNPDRYNVSMEVTSKMNGKSPSIIVDSCSLVKQELPDTTAPTISGLQNKTIEEGALGNTISWHISDDRSSGEYFIYRNGTQVDTGNWTSVTYYLVENLTIGIYNFTLRAFDSAGNSAEGSNWVTIVLDTTVPIISGPSDFQVEVGTTGNKITWLIDDSHPANYTVYKNGTFFSDGNYTQNDAITINIDNLALGWYEFNLTAYDTANRTNSDIVLVEVVTEIITPPPDSDTNTNTNTDSNTMTDTNTNSTNTNSSSGNDGNSKKKSSPFPVILVPLMIITIFVRRYYRQKLTRP